MTNNKAQQSAEKTAEQQQVLRDLLALGKKNGRLTLKEMADALSHLELESDDIDKLYETLESMGASRSRPKAFWKRRSATATTTALSRARSRRFPRRS